MICQAAPPIGEGQRLPSPAVPGLPQIQVIPLIRLRNIAGELRAAFLSGGDSYRAHPSVHPYPHVKGGQPGS